jgi:hypothetical protein
MTGGALLGIDRFSSFWIGWEERINGGGGLNRH